MPPNTNSVNKKQLTAASHFGGGSPAKKRRLNEEDLIAREELGPDDQDWEANDRFDVIGHLGDGTYGTVYKAIDKNRGNEVVAVKKIRFQLDDYDRMPVCVVREIANLKYLQRNSFDFPIIRWIFCCLVSLISVVFYASTPFSYPIAFVVLFRHFDYIKNNYCVWVQILTPSRRFIHCRDNQMFSWVAWNLQNISALFLLQWDLC